MTARTDSGSYAVGNAVEAESDAGLHRLFTADPELDDAVVTAGAETFLSESLDSELRAQPGTTTPIGYIDRDTAVTAQLVRAGTALDVEFEPVNPGMAVCYDVFGSQPTGIGITVDDGLAFGTLAVAGIPVATARIEYGNQWYDVTGTAGTLDTGGPRSEWARERYVALFGELLAELATRTPSLGEPVAVAVGGGDAPEGMGDGDIDRISVQLQPGIESVTVAETPDTAPARGALAAVEGSSDSSQAIPAFAATETYTPGLADTAMAAEAFANGSNPQAAETSLPGKEPDSGDGQQQPSHPHEGGPETANGHATDHRIRLAAVLDSLVEQVDNAETTDRLAEIRAEITSAVADLESELDRLDEETASRETVAELDSSVSDLVETFEKLDKEVSEIQTAVTGLDEDTAFDGPAVADALESITVDTLQDDIDSVDETLTNRIETLWDELDEIRDQVVDVSARVRELPDLEGGIESATESIDELWSETTEIRRSITEIADQIDSLEQQTVPTSEITSVQSDLDRLTADHDELQTRFENVDRADPAAVTDLQRDLDALQETVVNHAQRLEGIERTVSDLDDRIGEAFRNTAKADALTSLQAEVSRIEERATAAEKTANDAEQTTERLEPPVEQVQTDIDQLQEDIDQLRKMVDSIAESSISRPELDDSLTQLEQQIPGQGVASRFMLQILGGALAAGGGLGALLAAQSEQPGIALGFVLFVVGPALWLLVTVSEP